MKTITVQTLGANIEAILKEQEKLAQIQGQKFTAIPESSLITEINKRLGGEWALKKDSPVKFTPQDLNAVANNRFMRGAGSHILMQLAIAILGLALLAQFRLIPMPIYFGLSLLVAIFFLYRLTKKQAEAKKSFWKGIDGDGVESGK